MQRSSCLRGAIFLFAAALLPLAAQTQFQKPTQEELKMTSDPAAPGAAAVYLDYKEIDNDPLHYRSIYSRIKVLTDKGKDLAIVDLPYVRGKYKITSISGRTIHPDGTVIPLTGKPEDLMTAKSGDREIARKVFTLPSVTVGSILEYRYQIGYDDSHYSSPYWDVQGKYFVHKAHYEFAPFENFMPHPTEHSSTILTDAKGNTVNSLVWWFNLPKGVNIVQMPDRYVLDVTDVPPAPDEEYMPPIESVLYKVVFYYENSPNAQQYWIDQSKAWSKEVDKYAEPSKALKDAAAGLVSAGDSDLVKAQKLYKAVEALDNTDYSRIMGASERKARKLKEARHAEDTWKQKSGSSEQIALLYLAMARAAGLSAFAVKVVDRDRAIFDASLMDMDQLDSTLVVVRANGKDNLLDPGEKMCTFGEVSWKHSDAGGVWQSPKGPGFMKTPSQVYPDNLLVRSGDVTLDASGGMTGYFTFTMRGQEALRWRQEALENSSDLKKAFDRWLQPTMPQGVEGHLDHFLGLDQPDSNLLAIVKVKGALGTSLPRRLLMPGLFFESRGTAPFVKEAKRTQPVDMQYAEEISDEVTYHLPQGYTVEGAPKDEQDLWQGHAQYIVKTRAAAGQITVARLLARAFDVAKPDEYQDLRGFYQKVAAADQSELVLSEGPAGKGN